MDPKLPTCRKIPQHLRHLPYVCDLGKRYAVDDWRIKVLGIRGSCISFVVCWRKFFLPSQTSFIKLPRADFPCTGIWYTEKNHGLQVHFAVLHQRHHGAPPGLVGLAPARGRLRRCKLSSHSRPGSAVERAEVSVPYQFSVLASQSLLKTDRLESEVLPAYRFWKTRLARSSKKQETGIPANRAGRATLPKSCLLMLVICGLSSRAGRGIWVFVRVQKNPDFPLHPDDKLLKCPTCD